MKLKKTLQLTTLATALVPISFVSCALSPYDAKNFDVGFAITPISSLNYIKYGNAVNFAHSVVEGFGRQGIPQGSTLRNFVDQSKVVFGQSKKDGNSIRRFNEVSSWDKASSVLRQYEGGYSSVNKSYQLGFSWKEVPGRVWTSSDKYGISINPEQVWANGQNVTASNFIDSIVYILDLNTGSNLKEKILSLNIKNSRDFIDAQNEYVKVFGAAYTNPFGYTYKYVPNRTEKIKVTTDKTTGESKWDWKITDEEYAKTKAAWVYYQQRHDHFPLQNQKHPEAAKERELVKKIETAARGLGVYGGKYSSHPDYNNNGPNKYEITEDPKYTFKNPETGEADITPFQLRIETENAASFIDVFRAIGFSYGFWLPVNKKFIEDIGGIEKFGQDQKNFLTAGPFNIKRISFNTGGNIILEKNNQYHNAKNILSNKIKIFFQDDQNVKAAMFEDGYIAETVLNTINVEKLYADSGTRKLIEKAGGQGVYALTMNVDEETNFHPALLDPDFRRALFFAIDRNQIISRSEFDTTAPYYSLLSQETPAGLSQYGNPDDIHQGYVFADETTNFGDGYDEVPFFSVKKQALDGNNQLFSNFSTKDKISNKARANAFLDKYKARNPGQSSVKIEFTHDSSTALVNIGLELKDQLNKAFDGYVDLELKGYPKETYDNYRVAGKFGITAMNLDYLPTRLFGPNEAFLYGDPIRKDDLKSQGFMASPAGSWTVETAILDLENKTFGESEEEVRVQLGISQIHWDTIKALTKLGTPTETENIAFLETKRRKRIMSFLGLSSSLNTKDFDTDSEVALLSASLNKFVMYMAPALPILHVDVRIKISRLSEAPISLGYGELSFDAAYDLARKPMPDLPGMEIK